MLLPSIPSVAPGRRRSHSRIVVSCSADAALHMLMHSHLMSCQLVEHSTVLSGQCACVVLWSSMPSMVSSRRRSHSLIVVSCGAWQLTRQV